MNDGEPYGPENCGTKQELRNWQKPGKPDFADDGVAQVDPF
jgi:hypothetical protein